MTRSEFVSICRECDITVDGDSGYWKQYLVISYNSDEESIHAGFYKPEKNYKVAKENVMRMVNKFKELELIRKKNMMNNKLEQIKEDF